MSMTLADKLIEVDTALAVSRSESWLAADAAGRVMHATGVAVSGECMATGAAKDMTKLEAVEVDSHYLRRLR